MRFSEVLHPEIILNKRGDKHCREMYSEMLSMLHIESSGSYTFDLPKNEHQVFYAQMLLNDGTFAQHIGLCKKFKESQGKVYHLGKDLAKVFSRIDKDIPLDILPKRFCAYISFPKETISDEEGFVEGGYVAICPRNEAPDIRTKDKIPGEDEATHFLWMSYVMDAKDSPLGIGAVGGFLMPLLEAKISDLIKFGPTRDNQGFFESEPSEESKKKREYVYRALLNAVIYLFSENAELELARPVSHLNVSKNKLLKSGKVINECTVPITFIYRNYHGTTHIKESTWVQTYPRWQRCGPSNSLVKLIWVSAHERHYGTSLHQERHHPENPG